MDESGARIDLGVSFSFYQFDPLAFSKVIYKNPTPLQSVTQLAFPTPHSLSKRISP